MVFREYIHAEPTKVYHVRYGASEALLPERFMNRFRGSDPLVRNVLDGIAVVDQKLLVDKISREEAIRLDIREIRVQSDTAEADLVYSASHTSHAVKFILVRDGPQWKVKERKMGWIACG